MHLVFWALVNRFSYILGLFTAYFVGEARIGGKTSLDSFDRLFMPSIAFILVHSYSYITRGG